MLGALFKPKNINKDFKRDYLKVQDQIKTLNIVSEAITGITDLDEVLGLILKKLKVSWQLKFPSIYLFDDEFKFLSIRAFDAPLSVAKAAEKTLGGDLQKLFKLEVTKDSKNILVQSLLTRSEIKSTEFYDFVTPLIPNNVANIMQRIMSLRSMVAIPLIIKDNVLGVMAVSSPNTSFTDIDIEGIKAVANQISMAIYNTTLLSKTLHQVTQLEAQNRDLESLYNLTSQIAGTLSTSEIGDIVVSQLVKQKNILCCILFKYDNKQAKLELINGTKSENIEYKMNRGELVNEMNDTNLLARSNKSKQPLSSTDISELKTILTDKTIKFLDRDLGAKSVVALPLFSGFQIIGNLCFVLTDNYDMLKENEQRQLKTYAIQVSTTLDKANIYEKMQSTLKQLQEMRRKEKDMIDVMGHELRTPITIVRNSLLMLDGLKNNEAGISREKLDKYLEMAIESTRREIDIIETLLAATKLDSNRLQFSKEKVDMKDVIHDAVESQKFFAEEKSIELRNLDTSKELYSYSDRNRTQEIMDNLLSNAVKYTQTGYIEISTRKENGMIYVSIKDTGIGIDKEDITNLGKKFFRAKQYINNEKGSEKIVRPGGTGLGLYVVFGAIRGMGGDIQIDSEVGKGSTFTFFLPEFSGQEEVKYADIKTKQKISITGEKAEIKQDNQNNTPTHEIIK